jgi:hypothetical protein
MNEVKFSYPTNRIYDGKPQVLDIVIIEGPDEWTLVGRFVDSVRNLSGIVELIGYDMNSSKASLGRAVLQEYDAGRYHPL